MKININQRLESQKLRIKVLDEAMEQEIQQNPLLALYNKLDDYYKEWRVGSKLVAVLPTLPIDHEKRQTYYSSGEVSAVFLYKNPPIDSNAMTDNNYNQGVFIFHSEETTLFKYEKIPHLNKYEQIKKPNFNEIINHLNNNPVVLFFKGCDDGHVGKRFKTEQEAMDFLQMLDVFEDVFEFPMEYHN